MDASSHINAVCPHKMLLPHTLPHLLRIWFYSLQIWWVLVHLLVWDISISASKASGGFKIFYSKNLLAFFARNIYVFTLLSCFWFHLLHSRKLPHECHRILWFLLLGMLSSGYWWIITKQKETTFASANYLSVVLFSTGSMLPLVHLLQSGSSRKAPNFKLNSQVLITTESLPLSAVRIVRLAFMHSALSALLIVQYFLWASCLVQVFFINWLRKATNY